MPGWERHTYRKWRQPRPVIKDGTGSLKNGIADAEPVNPGPIAGFARPLQATINPVTPTPTPTG